ncbi:MAG: hypothetical protein G4A98_02960 [Buchnera aphidicola (Microlophium carnosum)]|uniref:Hydroxymethylbilane synthase n=1 Tax=Buchnera aphidicola (Microlophium carnosum) TaxID=2708354 RepID=A0A6G9JTQ9_9GAMM|nr:MAG: hypothetical protein G4A98_02960 [Buchnera aphidicola (Microlophium carnosum)]
MKSVLIVTYRDNILNQSLSKIKGKGLSIKKLENVLLEHKTNITTHLMKDLSVNVT